MLNTQKSNKFDFDNMAKHKQMRSFSTDYTVPLFKGKEIWREKKNKKKVS